MSESKQILISQFNRNSLELIKIHVNKWKGNQYLDVRVYYDASENEQPDWRPSRKGITLSLDLIEELEKGLRQAQEYLEKTSESVQEKQSPAGE